MRNRLVAFGQRLRARFPALGAPARLRSRLRYRAIQRRLAGPTLLRAFADSYPEARFIEIGSNDGEQHDHLRPLILTSNWSGIMVEPVPYVFDRLRENYAGVEGLLFENVAIADEDGELPFFHLREANEDELRTLPHWYLGLGSFSRSAVLGHEKDIPDIKDRLVETRVRCLAFDSLCERHGWSRFDLLLIDTEGFDWEILKNIDLEAYRPRLVIYEHYHLSPDERTEALQHLRNHGYAYLEEGFDTFCIDTRIDDALASTWRSLTPAVPGVSVHDA